MKTTFYILSLCLAACLLSCGKGDGKGEKVNERVYQLSSDSQTGEYEMQPSLSEGTAALGGAEYSYRIQRNPSRQLPLVKDEQGNRFVDNTIDLVVERNGKQIVSKQFTKRDFASQVDAKFLAKSILEGLVFDRPVDGHLRFAASVCYPQTDVFVPLCVMVSAQGSVRIEKGSVLEEAIPGGEQ